MRHFDYIEHYERQAQREAAKKKPNAGLIASHMAYVAHSRTRIEILNEAFIAEFNI
jgi:hypothetical protein